MSVKLREQLPRDYKAEEARRSDAIARRVYARYQTRFATAHLFKKQNQEILSALVGGRSPSTFRLLDVGCGFGSLLKDALAQGVQAYGVELAPWNARTAHRDVPQAPVCLGDAENLPFLSGTYDGVVLKGVLHHLGNPQRALAEIHRVLKPGGCLCIFEGDPTARYRRFVLGLADLLGIQHETTLFRHLTPQEVVRLLQASGFTQISKRPVSGLFVPVGLQGWGGPLLWRGVFDRLEGALQSRWPSLFRWHHLFLGVKPSR